MFTKHDAYRARLAGHPFGNQRLKQVCLFLTVMAAIGKVADEIDGLLSILAVKLSVCE
jgi:hypothetical protein